MKFLFLSFLLSFNVYGVNYFFSAEGNDKNSGTNELSSWRLINKLDEIPLNAGDTVNVRCGDEFHGSVKLYNLQGDDENPIIFRSYNNGIKPLLSGNSRTDQSVLSFSNFKR